MHSTLAYGELVNSPIGPITLVASNKGIVRVSFQTNRDRVLPQERGLGNLQAFQFIQQGLTEINVYLKGDLKEGFNVPVDWEGLSAFQKKVLEVTRLIQWGEVRTYKDIAKEVNASPIAVGSALANNPFLLLIPCHRVIGSDMKMHGYAAPDGIRTKEWLLKQEGLSVSHGKVIRNTAPRLFD